MAPPRRPAVGAIERDGVVDDRCDGGGKLGTSDVAGGSGSEALEGGPLEQIHDDEDGAVVRDVIVEDRHCAGMDDLVRDVPFAHEARPQLLVGPGVRMQNLAAWTAALPP